MRIRWFIFMFVAITLGCGMATKPSSRSKASDARVESATTSEAKQPSTTTDLNESALRRKIIYHATMELVVDNFDPVQKKIDALVEQFHGYLAKSNISGRPGSPRIGRWTVRVPVEQYNEFLAEAREVGEVRRIASDSKDVTEEFYDIEARIRNKKQEEARLKDLLDKATGKLEEILSVEKEITRVRGEVEQLEGRMRVLSDLTALATIELQVDEIKDYVPEEAPNYSTQLRRSFNGSVATLITAGKNITIAAVAIFPWLVVFLVLGLCVLLVVRIQRKRNK
jgi:hypothetical protein